MKSNRYQVVKAAVGVEVFRKFEDTIESPSFDAKANVKRIEEASKLVVDMPYVTLPFRDKGIIAPKESNAGYLHIFQPNIWVQDFAHSIGKLDTMTIESSVERADAVIEHKLENSKQIQSMIKSQKFDETAIRKAMQEAAMIESILYERLGGTKMPDSINDRIDIACMKRLAKDSHIITEAVSAAGVSVKDALGLLQIAKEFDIVGILQQMVETDPYFKRRSAQLAEFKEINSGRSLGLEVVKTKAFASRILESIAKRYPGMINDQLIERVGKISGL